MRGVFGSTQPTSRDGVGSEPGWTLRAVGSASERYPANHARIERVPPRSSATDKSEGEPMPIQLQTAIIAAVVALLTGGSTAFLSWMQFQRERTKYLVSLKADYAIELYRTRLETYPAVFAALSRISSRTEHGLTTEAVHGAGIDLNSWFYSRGGMCAEATTRGAIRLLRSACLRWSGTDEPSLAQLYELRNSAVLLLRRDLDLTGLENLEFADDTTLLARIKSEVESLL